MTAAVPWIVVFLLLAVLSVLLAGRRFSHWQQFWRVLGSSLSAALLWLALFPPQRALEPQELVVLSAEADAATALERQGAGAIVLALPEAPQIAGIARVPDLATALRRTPQASTLQVLGRGLPVRDQATPVPLPMQFDPLPELDGLLHWSAPDEVAHGAAWTLSGELAGLPGATLVLLDPTGTELARATPDAAGRFDLRSRARSAGRMLHALQVRDADEQVLETVDIPLLVRAGEPAKVLLLAGAPSPELKYLRRWAVDAGLKLSSRLALGQNMQIGAAAPAAGPDGWSQWDLLVLDERSLAALGETGRSQLRSGIRAGAGVLLRLTGPLGAVERRWLADLDLNVQAADLNTQIKWPDARDQVATDSATASAASPSAVPLQLSRRPLTVLGQNNMPLLHSPTGEPLGVWRPMARGRLGIVWLTDSYKLQLSGRSEQHASLWQAVFSTLLRASAEPAPVSLQSALPLRVDQRLVLCGLDPARSYSLHGDSTVQHLHIDPTTPSCAGGWPQASGWLELRADEVSVRQWYVHPAGSAPARQARALSEFTTALEQRSAQHPVPDIAAAQPGPAWPWWLAWLLLSCALWWYERRGWLNSSSK